MNKYINDAIMIGYILTFLGIVGTVGALETDTIGIGHFVLQILACLGVGWIITRIHNRFGEPFTDDKDFIEQDVQDEIRRMREGY